MVILANRTWNVFHLQPEKNALEDKKGGKNFKDIAKIFFERIFFLEQNFLTDEYFLRKILVKMGIPYF